MPAYLGTGRPAFWRRGLTAATALVLVVSLGANLILIVQVKSGAGVLRDLHALSMDAAGAHLAIMAPTCRPRPGEWTGRKDCCTCP
ncbi:MAG: hypothetical protein AB1445_15500 [Bacillota bacterium]